MSARRAYPPEIAAAMGAEPTEEQWHAISMPLEPYVVVAGAGSVMGLRASFAISGVARAEKSITSDR